MHLGLIEPRDHAQVAEIAQLGAQTLDIGSELKKSWSHLWVARDSAPGPALGFLLAWSVADELHVINVATHPDFRRRGVGRALLCHALEHAGRSRARLVLLEVRRSNTPAIALYRANGFSMTSVRRGYYAENEDAIEMMLAMDPETGLPLPGHDEVSLEEA
jgi:ribosomal-protein-alanine N-acetyltransferase